MATHLEFYVEIFADLLTSHWDIKRIVHILPSVKTIYDLRTLNEVFIKKVNYIKTTRDYMELRNQNILDDNQRKLHFASKDSQKSFKLLQKLEDKIIPLRRMFKLSMAVNETGIAYQKIYGQRQNATYKKYIDKIGLIYRKWEKYPKLRNIFDKLVKQLLRKSDELDHSTKNLFFDIQISNRSQISKLSHHYKNIISESLQKGKAMIEFCFFKMKLAVKQFKISSGLDQRFYSKFNTGEDERQINMGIYTKNKNEFGYSEIMVIFKCLKSVAILKSKIVVKCIEANWKSRRKKKQLKNKTFKFYFT